MAFFRVPARVASLSEGLDLYSKVSTIFLGVVVVFYALQEYGEHGQAFKDYDVMQISGFSICLIGVIVSFGMRPRFIELIRGLIRSGSVRLQTGPEDFEKAIKRSVGRRCLAVMMILPMAVAAAYLLAGHIQSRREVIEAAFAFLAASAVGERFGRLITYARAASLVSQPGADFVINFWHPDKAGGLLPISKFYLYTALLASIPAVWLSFWWVAIPPWPRRVGSIIKNGETQSCFSGSLH